MERSYRYFDNRDCKYFPCHQGAGEDFNCLFCYCPMYRLEACPGEPNMIDYKGKTIKDCTHCTYPHDPAHYDEILEFLKNA